MPTYSLAENSGEATAPGQEELQGEADSLPADIGEVADGSHFAAEAPMIPEASNLSEAQASDPAAKAQALPSDAAGTDTRTSTEVGGSDAQASSEVTGSKAQISTDVAGSDAAPAKSRGPAKAPGANPGLTNEAQIGDTYYPKLADAIAAAQDGDLIKIIAADAEGDARSIEIPEIWINKKITIDMNGRDIRSYNYLCLYTETGDLTVINSGTYPANLNVNLFNYDNKCKMTIGDKVEVMYNEIWTNPNTVIDGGHLLVQLKYDPSRNNGQLYPVTFGDSFTVSDTVQISFQDENFVNDLKDPNKAVDDVLLAKNVKKDIAKCVLIQDVDNPAITFHVEDNGDLFMHKAISDEWYLNGSSGNDANDGKTIDTPVKSIEKIKTLLADPSLAGRKKTVYVTGTVGMQDAQSLEFPAGSDVEFYRYPRFGGSLFHVGNGGKLSIAQVTIDGNKHKISLCGSPLIEVADGGLVSIKDGAILQNNMYTSLDLDDFARGGAIQAMGGSTVEMSGGIIRWNKAFMGGGIYAANATLRMTGGLITENEVMSTVYKGKNYYSTGGGISAILGSQVTMSGGTISANTAYNGAGFALGSYGPDMHRHPKSTLTMTGGVMENNIAEASGGGLFIQAGAAKGIGESTQCIAYIKGGTFRNNTAKTGLYGGGGIYVNGTDIDGIVSGELHLENALIKDNDAGKEGGGYAACPTTKTYSHINSSTAIFDNHGQGGQDISIHGNAPATGSPYYEFPHIALGGGLNRWIIDQQTDNGSNGKELPLNAYAGNIPVGTVLSVKSGLTAEEKALAESLAQVKIIGNHAGEHGGGIGSNGTVYFGTGDAINLTVQKMWNDEKNKEKRPEKIKVGIYRAHKGTEEAPTYFGFGEIYPDRSGNWSLTFPNLPKNDETGDFVYTAQEILDDEALANYLVTSTEPVSGNDGVIKITNTYEEVTVQGHKVWKDQDNQEQKRPAEVTVRLLQNGTEIDSKVLNEENGWAFRFDGLPKYENGKEILYTIAEDGVDGYQTLISAEGKYTFTITNSREVVPPKPPKPPKPETPNTGDSHEEALYTGLLVLCFVLLVGLRRNLRKRK